MHPWRRSLAENGLTLAWLAARTGKSVATVRAYSVGARRPHPEWIAKAEAAIAEYERTAA